MKLQANSITAVRPVDRGSYGDLFLATLLTVVGVLGLICVTDAGIWGYLSGLAGGADSVATVTLNQGSLRYRPVGGAVWVNVANGAHGVNPGDVIFTGPDSTARLDFPKAGLSVEISPRTLVVVHDPSIPKRGKSWWLRARRLVLRSEDQMGEAVRLEHGRITVKYGQTVSLPVQVATGERVYEIRPKTTGSKLVISVPDPVGSGQISVHSAEPGMIEATEITSKAPPSIVKTTPDQPVFFAEPAAIPAQAKPTVIRRDTGGKPGIALTEPPDQAVFIAGRDIFLTWDKLLVPPYTLQIARDPRFERRVMEETQQENFLIFLPRSEGSYFWRVRSEDSAWSKTRQFTVK